MTSFVCCCHEPVAIDEVQQMTASTIRSSKKNEKRKGYSLRLEIISIRQNLNP